MHDSSPYEFVSCKQRHQYPFISKFILCYYLIANVCDVKTICNSFCFFNYICLYYLITRSSLFFHFSQSGIIFPNKL